MKKYIVTLLILVSAGFTACETEIDYRGDEQEPMLVLNCLAEAGTTATVSVSHSLFFLGSSEQVDLLLKDAVVTLDINGQPATLAYDSEWDLYTDDRILAEGDRLKVTVTHPRYGTVTAEDVVPRHQGLTGSATTLPFANSTSATSLTEDTPGVFDYTRTDSLWRVTLHINDPAGESNFYRLKLSVSDIGRVTPEGSELWLLQGGTQFTEEPDDDDRLPILYDVYFGVPSSTQFTLGISDDDLSSLGINMNLSSIYYDGSATFIFTDEYLNGTGGSSDLTFDVWMHTPFWWGEREGWYDPDKHTISTMWIDDHDEEVDYGTPWDYLDRQFTYTFSATLESITPSYYYYLISSEKYDATNWTLFSEPVTVYSNVTDGVGILGLQSAPCSVTFQRDYTFQPTH